MLYVKTHFQVHQFAQWLSHQKHALESRVPYTITRVITIHTEADSTQ